jgi:uncharacterized protein YjbJ (UPF0337 family)
MGEESVAATERKQRRFRKWPSRMSVDCTFHSRKSADVQSSPEKRPLHWRFETVNWDQIEGNWKQWKGQAKQKWAKLKDSDWTMISGKKDELVGRIQERYGYNREQAEREADAWSRDLKSDVPTL